jgi:hypothetical protein
VGPAALQAWVQDAGATVSYRLSATNPVSVLSCFAINFGTGALTTSCSTLDYVSQQLWSLLVEAVSQPAGTLFDTARVFVSVVFVQQPPAVMSPPLISATGALTSSLSVLENATVGTMVGRLLGFGRDAAVIYAITGSTSTCAVPPHTALAINTTTGELSISVAGVLNWDDCVAFTLLVNLSGEFDVATYVSLMIYIESLMCITLVTDTSLLSWQVPVSIPINVLDASSVFISEVRLAPNDEAAGLGVDLLDYNSPNRSQYPSPAGVTALFVTSGAASMTLSGKGLGLTQNRIDRTGDLPTSFVVTYGPPAQPTLYTAGPCSIVVAGSKILCKTAPGAGQQHVWLVQVRLYRRVGSCVVPHPTLSSFVTLRMHETLYSCYRIRRLAGHDCGSNSIVRHIPGN